MNMKQFEKVGGFLFFDVCPENGGFVDKVRSFFFRSLTRFVAVI
nr:hypothetical protein LGRDSM20601_p0071 [Listeria grayi]